MRAHGEIFEDGATEVIELASGQCTVVQCNHEVGRSFIKSLIGERTPHGCRVTYRGEPLSLSEPLLAKRAGFCSLDEGLYERLKVREYLNFWTELYEVRPTTDELLRQIGLEGKSQEWISRLSYSEKRLLGFARSILHDPELVIWEEPEQNLDLESCMIVRRLIDELLGRGKSMLITCATLEQSLSISNRIYLLNGRTFTPIAIQEAAESNESEGSFAGTGEETPERIGAELPDHALKLSKLMVKTDDKYVFVDPRQVYYVESIEGVTHLYTNEAALPCAWTLAELEDKLKPYRFYRCHRSYIVNLDCLTELIVWSRNSYSLVLSDDKKSRIPLSKGKFEELKAIVGP